MQNRLKEIKDEPEYIEERTIIEDFLNLMDQESDAIKKISQAQKELNNNVNAKYLRLSEQEVRTLVVKDKWLTTLRAEIENEVEKISQNLKSRVNELSERYAYPLSYLELEIESLSKNVEHHLVTMGYEWK